MAMEQVGGEFAYLHPHSYSLKSWTNMSEFIKHEGEKIELNLTFMSLEELVRSPSHIF